MSLKKAVLSMSYRKRVSLIVVFGAMVAFIVNIASVKGGDVSYAYSKSNNAVYSNSLISIKNELDKKGRNFNSDDYIKKLKNEINKAMEMGDKEDIALSISLLSKVIYNSGDIHSVKDFIKLLLSLKEEFSSEGWTAFLDIHLVKMERLLGNKEAASEYFNEGVSLSKKISQNDILCELYYVSSLADVVDLNMNTETYSNLQKAIEIAETTKDFSVNRLIDFYILQSQVELYFNKDASLASDLLGKALLLSKEDNLDDYILKIQELHTATYPYFFKYDEGISYLKPLIDKRIRANQYLEAVIDVVNLSNMYFESGMYDEALSLESTLKDLISKVENPLYKKYFNEYSLTLYSVNKLFLEGKYLDAISLLESYDYTCYDNFISIDNSVINMFLGSLYSAIGDNDKSLECYLKMFEAIKNNSNNNEYVYTDSSLLLGSSYASVNKYKEAYNVLKQHLDAYLEHQMVLNSRESEKLHKMYNTERNERIELQNKFLLTSTIFLSSITILSLAQVKRFMEYNKTLSNLSVTDPLTGLSNRRVLDEFLNNDSKLHDIDKDSDLYVSVIMLDIDYFKLYNDNYGHIKGDKILKNVGKILKEYSFGINDIVARYGGEEFTLVLIDVPVEKSLEVAEKIRVAIKNLGMVHEFSECSDVVSVSIGVSTKKINDEDFSDIICDADKALYVSKTAGRDRVSHFSKI